MGASAFFLWLRRAFFTASCLLAFTLCHVVCLRGPRFKPLSRRTRKRLRAPGYTLCQTSAAARPSSAKGESPKTSVSSDRRLQIASRLLRDGKMRSVWENRCSMPQEENVRACQWAISDLKEAHSFLPVRLPLRPRYSMPKIDSLHAAALSPVRACQRRHAKGQAMPDDK